MSQNVLKTETTQQEITPELKLGFRPVLWWALFLLSTYAMSLFFQGFRNFTATPNSHEAMNLLGVIALNIILLTVLIYDGYIKEKQKGKLQRTFFAFEWLYQRQCAHHQHTANR